jgi:hypothetical protein
LTNGRKLFFDALRYSLGLGEPISRVEDIDTLRALYRLSREHDLAHLVSFSLSEATLPEGAEEARRAFKKQEDLAIFRHGIMSLEYSRITEALENAAIPFLPLKGARVRAFYPKGWMRTSCDVDVLVHEEDLTTALAVMTEKLGYSFDGKHYHDVSLHSPSGVHLELHFSIKENSPRIDPTLEEVWSYASPIAEGKYEHALTSEFFLFHHIAHAYYHFKSGGCGMKALVDLYLLEHGLTLDRELLSGLLEGAGIARLYSTLSALAEAVLGGGEFSEVERETLEFILSGGVYGNETNNITAARTEGGKKRSYLAVRLFPPYSTLSVRYPVLKRHKYLLPFFVVLRWFDIFSKKKRRRAIGQLTKNVTITEGELERSKQLFDNLGI